MKRFIGYLRFKARRFWTTVAATSLLVCASQAQDAYAGSFYFDVRDHLAYAVVVKPVTTIRDIQIGKTPKFSLDVNAFAGAGIKDGQAVAGFSLTRTWHVAQNADLLLGVGFAMRQGEKLPSSTGPMLGLRVSF